MPRTGGTYSLPPGYFAVSGEVIQPSQHNPPLEDIAQALTDSVPRNGAAPMTGNLAMGSNRITGLAAPINNNDAVRKAYVDNGFMPIGGGSVNGSITITDAAPYLFFMETDQASGSRMTSIGSGSGYLSIHARDDGGSITSTIANFDRDGGLGTAQSVVTRGTGDGRYMQQSWTLTAGDGLSGGGNGGSNRTLSVDSSVVRNSRTIATGAGLSGGGNLSANRTLTVDTGWLDSRTAGQYAPLSRTIATGDGLSGGGNLSANRTLSVDGTVVRTSRTVSAGNGMTGGGDLSSNRTITMGTPSSITADSTNSVTTNSHTHAISNLTIRQLIAMGSAGAIGTFCFASYDGGGAPIAFGSNVAGGTLTPASERGSNTHRSGSVSGTWQCLGYVGDSGSCTMWMRVS